VGLGESVHGAAELITLKHRALRLLVEQMGFRTVAWEEDWSTGVLIDDYIQGGAGDLDGLMARMSPQWQSQEVADVLRWLRDANAGRADEDKVRFFGVEHYFTWHPAYDAVEAYVAERAPERLPELRSHFDLIEPTADNVFAHIEEYAQVEDKQPFIDHARQLHDLVATVSHAPGGDLTHELTLHAARQIVSFYEHFSLAENDSFVFRDARAAENLRWWRGVSGDKIAYWGASAHTANVRELRITRPPEPDMVFPNAGSYLRRWFGPDYLSIGFTFDHGTVSLGPGENALLGPPERQWVERPFGRVRIDTFVADLRTRAPRPVRVWLGSPLTTRGLADRPGSTMSGGSLAQWYDLVVHREDVSPVATNGR
jgi:erythromycin esterase-like protein